MSHSETFWGGGYDALRGLNVIPKPVSLHSAEYKIFLRHLRATRKASGLTQEQVADRLGKPQSYISKCQSGERRMDLVEIRAFCKAIDKPVSEFVADLDAQLDQLEPEAAPG